MFRIYTGEQPTSSAPLGGVALPNPRVIAQQDFATVAAICSGHSVKTGPKMVEFKLLPGETIVDLVKTGASAVWRCLNETGVTIERLEKLQVSDPDGNGVVRKFERKSSIARERDVSVVIVDPNERGSEKRLGELRRAGYRLGSDLEATVAHLMYRLETSQEGLRGAIDDAALSANSGLPVEPRWTQKALFSIARCSQGLLRYSSMEGVVSGDFGFFEARFLSTSPTVMVKVK